MSHSNKKYSKNKSVKIPSKGGNIFTDYIKVTSNTNKDIVDLKSIRDELEKNMDNINKSISDFMTTYKKLTAKVNTIDVKISNITNVNSNCEQLYPEIKKKDEDSKGIMGYMGSLFGSNEPPKTTEENTTAEEPKKEPGFFSFFGNKSESDKPESDKSESDKLESDKQESDKSESDKPESDKSQETSNEDTSKEEHTGMFSNLFGNSETSSNEDTSKEHTGMFSINSDNSSERSKLDSIIDAELNKKLYMFDEPKEEVSQPIDEENKLQPTSELSNYSTPNLSISNDESTLKPNDEEKTSQIENPFIPNYYTEQVPNYYTEPVPNEQVPNYSNEPVPNEQVPNYSNEQDPNEPVPNYSNEPLPNDYVPNSSSNDSAPNELDSKPPSIFKPLLANGGIKKKNKTIKKKKRKSNK
jgi:hypothetical protein